MKYEHFASLNAANPLPQAAPLVDDAELTRLADIARHLIDLGKLHMVMNPRVVLAMISQIRGDHIAEIDVILARIAKSIDVNEATVEGWNDLSNVR